MAETKGTTGLEVDEDLGFQEKEWTVERIGWVIGLLLLILAFAGVFGGGPVSSATVEEGPLQVAFHRFVRYRSPEEMTIHVAPTLISDGKVQVWVGREYISQFEVQKIVPEPDQVQLFADRILYEFQVPEPAQQVRITFQFQAERIGSQNGLLGSGNLGQQVQFTQFVFP